MPSASSKKSPKKSFVPLLLASESAEVCAALCETLSGCVEGEAEFVDIDTLAVRLGKRGNIGAVVLDGRTLDPTGPVWREVIKALRVVAPAVPVVVYAEGLSGVQVAAALRGGAQEALFPEQLRGELPETLRVLVTRRAARSSGHLFSAGPGVPKMLGRAVPMQEVARLVERVAPSDATVLILGESGTGKELVAQALHAFSPRRKGPFIAINCAAIPDTLLENELFGHEKGSFTGANATAIGKVEAAEKGTLFLDEIGEMPISLQAKILRLLQDKSYDRIGGIRTRTANVRIIAATNRELKQEVEGKRFREDLYYRLSVVPITLPSLRERPEDIPVLACAIMDRLAEKLSRPGLALSDEAMARMVAYRWPGNVRELENELERACVLTQGEVIQPVDLELRARVEDPDASALSRIAPLDAPLAEVVERASENARKIRVSVAMNRAGGDRKIAAISLGIEELELEELLGTS